MLEQRGDAMPYSKKLKLNYKKTPRGVKFDDGVFYNNREMGELGKISDSGLRIIHKAKKIFNGVIIGVE